MLIHGHRIYIYICLCINRWMDVDLDISSVCMPTGTAHGMPGIQCHVYPALPRLSVYYLVWYVKISIGVIIPAEHLLISAFICVPCVSHKHTIQTKYNVANIQVTVSNCVLYIFIVCTCSIHLLLKWDTKKSRHWNGKALHIICRKSFFVFAMSPPGTSLITKAGSLLQSCC